MRKTIIFIILLFLLTNFLPAQEKEMADEGKKIGNIISAAINMALPGMGDLVDIIWSKIAENRMRINKKEFEKMMEKSKEEIEKKMKANMKNKLSDLSHVVLELNTLSFYVNPTLNAKSYLEEIKSHLSDGKITIDESKLIKLRWHRVKENIDVLKNTDLDFIRYYAIFRGLNGIRNIHDKLIADIDDYYMSKIDLAKFDRTTISEFKSAINEIHKRFNEIGIILNFELEKIADEFLELYKSVTGSDLELPNTGSMFAEPISDQFSIEKMLLEINNAAILIKK